MLSTLSNSQLLGIFCFVYDIYGSNLPFHCNYQITKKKKKKKNLIYLGCNKKDIIVNL